MRPLFGRVLIANRGEIAVRVARTLRQLGIRSLAVFSPSDRDALHVRACDEAYALDGSGAAGGYLEGAALVELATRVGAEAVHPGYGFLAENADFAQAVAAAGIVFVGPSPAAMRTMGCKTRARAAMAAAGIPCVPGAAPPAGDREAVARVAEGLGFPVMVKAAAGGGGRGMRRVETADALWAAWQSAGREAQAAFADPSVYLERALMAPRHLEVQVFGEVDGLIRTLGERECSLQRRHQKVIEETPSVVLNDDDRERLVGLAERAAKAVAYVGAGTVEFLRDGRDGALYFLEMNTRLQVEHPVTEMCWGVDLVEAQLRAAAGEAGLLATSSRPMGHAIEARLCAEDPSSGFLPAPGPVACLRWPQGPGIRVEAGVAEGGEVSAHYDPLIAKIVAHGQTREQARRRLAVALDETWVAGPTLATNLVFLRQLLASPAFVAGSYHTGTVDEVLRGGSDPALTPARRRAALVAAVLDAYERDSRRAADAGRAPAAAGREREAWQLGMVGGV